MKKSIIFLQIFLFTAFATFAQVDRSKRPEAGPARAPQIGEYESFELKNGVKVFVVENHKLPRVSMSLIIDRDPIVEGSNAGYVELAGELIGRGTTNRTKEELDKEVDFMGARLSTSASSIGVFGLSKYTEKLIEIMADVAMNPSMTQEEFDKAKEQILSGLETVKDDPSAIMENVWSDLIYGKNHPYGEIVTQETVKNVSLEDCKMYHATYFKPNVAYIAVVGDVSVKKVKKMFNKYMGNWKPAEVPQFTYELPKTVTENTVALVDRQASVQSVIRIGNPIILKQGDADIDALRVMNVILGGGSMGRLYNNLREDKAYTYGAYSSFGTDELVSAFYAYAQVRNEVTDSAVAQFLIELDKMRTGKVTTEELNQAKASIMGSFGRSLEQPSTVAGFALSTARYNLPADYYQNYLKRVEAVTVEDIQRVAQKYISEDELLITIVGKGQDIAPGLEQFGKIEYYDMYANPTEAPSFLFMPEGVTAENVVNNYLKAIGGKDKLAKMTAFNMSMTAEMAGLPAPMNMTIAKKVPDYYMESQSIPGMYEAKKLYAKGKGTQSSPQGSGDLEGDELEDVKRTASVFMPEMNYLKGDYKITLQGQNILNGKDVYQLLVENASGAKTTEYYDVATGLKIQAEQTEETPRGPMTIVSAYGSYKSFGGILFPTTLVQSVGPQVININITDVKTNKEVSTDIFK